MNEHSEKKAKPGSAGELFQEILQRRLSRRGILQGSAAVAALAVTGPVIGSVAPAAAQTGSTLARPAAQTGALTFNPVPLSTSDEIVTAAGFKSKVLLRWGDPVISGGAAFNPNTVSAAAQASQFGYNNDFLMFMPLPLGSSTAHHGVLWVNHEYTNPELMFPGYDKKSPQPTREMVDVELAAHGGSIVEVARSESGEWSVRPDSNLNRRLTGMTPVTFTGPVVGHDWLKTTEDPTGMTVMGTLNNCGGGETPWGTILTAEENFHQYFGNVNGLPDSDPRKAVHTRYRLPTGESERRWETHYNRFDVSKEPNEPFRYGYVVEVDVYDPASTPRKHTALGRFLHEAATTVIAPNGKAVVYSGDDERFESVYKFVSAGTYNPNDRAANMNLLSEGTLYAAKFNDDGTGEWLPLVYGQGPLNEANGFTSQADVLLKTRMAAALVGATKMDRPEDIETNPVNGKLYMAMTNNNQRGEAGRPATDNANPRTDNRWGHIIEAEEAGKDATATMFNWNIFMLCGETTNESSYFAGYPKDQVSSIAAPDNIAFDKMGNLWIATDGQPSAIKANDGIYAVPTVGPQRGFVRQFMSSVIGAEMASLAFNTDSTALFVSVQHPGEGGTLEAPTSKWPDAGQPPRPSVVVAWSETGKAIGEA
ncbi:MAG: PhoX family protein [Chloroflexota bacterium]